MYETGPWTHVKLDESTPETVMSQVERILAAQDSVATELCTSGLVSIGTSAAVNGPCTYKLYGDANCIVACKFTESGSLTDITALEAKALLRKYQDQKPPKRSSAIRAQQFILEELSKTGPEASDDEDYKHSSDESDSSEHE